MPCGKERRSRRLAALPVVLGAFAVGIAAGGSPPAVTVTYIADGDTLTVSSGADVRLVQIDTPELGSGECFSRAAARELRRLAPIGSAVTLEADARLDDKDRYGRLLRYVWRDGVNVNLELVRRGAAAPYFYRGDRGRFASQLLAAALDARAHRRGLWGACPRARLDPGRAVDTGVSGPPATRAAPGCDPSYIGVCIPSPPPDLDCKDVPAKGFRVVGADPHRFDGDHDGLGCE